MRVTEIARYLFIRNGQYVTGELSSIDLSLEKFWICIEPEITKFEEYFPLVKNFNVNMTGVSPVVYDFSFDTNNVGYDATFWENPIFGNPPERIIKFVPVGQQQMVQNFITWTRTRSLPGLNGTLAQPLSTPYEYRKPKLYANYAGRFDVTAVYRYSRVEERDDNEVLTDVNLIGLERQPLLMDLLSGVFLQMLGRTRRAFTYTDLQITTDADQLVKEGELLYNDTLEKIYNQHDWHKAMRR